MIALKIHRACGLAILDLLLAGGWAAAAEMAPLRVDRPAGPRGIAVARFSDRTLSLAIQVDADRARLLSYTVKDRPLLRPPVTARPRAYQQGDSVQVEIVLFGPGGLEHTHRAEAGPLCLSHPAGTEPHVEGDTILLHRDAFLVEMPEVAGFDRIEVAYYDGGNAFMHRRPIGSERLDRARFTSAAGTIPYADLAFADASAPDVTTALTTSSVLWPEDFDDPDIYRIYGDPSEGAQRINITIVPDGYTYAEKSIMESHAGALVAHFRGKTPYAEHDPFINYTLIYAYSMQSGTDECDCGILLDTAMGTRFPDAGDPCGGSANRCLYYGSGGCDTSGTSNIIAAEQRAPFHDETFVMVNTPRYGGCGGSRAVYAAGHSLAAEIAVHELGHSLANLDDEYDGSNACGNVAGEINTSLDEVNGSWPEWIADIGAPREGARYYNQCVYRPVASCEMRALNQPFCPVCNQQWSLITYGHPRVTATAPVESLVPGSPATAVVNVPAPFGAGTRLSIGPGVTNSFLWTLTGPGYPLPTIVSTGMPTYSHTFTQEGQYDLVCEVTADTNFVKPSKHGANRKSASWTVNVFAPAGRVPDGSGAPGTNLNLSRKPNGDLSLSWGDSCAPGDTDYEIYEGLIGDFTSHVPVTCSTGGDTEITITPPADSTYYLVVPRNAGVEGSYGKDSAGFQRPPSAMACLPQGIAFCP